MNNDATYIKDRADLVSIVGRYIELKRSGPRYTGLCPFHDERTPSFTVTPQRGIYKCFGCGAHGDVFSFIMQIHRVDFTEAKRIVAELSGVTLSGGHTAPVRTQAPPAPARVQAPPSYHSPELLAQSLGNYDRNNFVLFLQKRFGADIASEVVSRYYIGTAKNGRCVFWLIDHAGMIRGGKIMKYDPASGKRDRTVNLNWMHSITKTPDFNFSRCLFGELLTKYPGKLVGIVESEKSAVIASIYLPDRVWLACGGGKNLNVKMMMPLMGRDVVLYPDLGNTTDGQTWFEAWSQIATDARKIGLSVHVSDLLEKTATEQQKADKYDLADFLLQYEPEQFQTAPAPHPPDVEQDVHSFAGWDAEPVQPLEDPAVWEKAKARARDLANWTDYRAGKGPNPYTNPDFWESYRQESISAAREALCIAA